ncbi:MAG TPA: TonB family protein [Terriglobales bacterium]|nr:TonB family protein [Terriglobales bacterium]
MTQLWRNLEGRVVGGKFRLTRYLGGSDHSAVFLTERPQGEPRKAAIKLLRANPDKTARQLDRWAKAEKLTHPHLLRMFEMGRCLLGDEELLYLVMEHAEEDLAQVVAARSLTPQECQEMLPPVLEALTYVHRHGFALGRLRPANIMAAQDRVKLSCDGLTVPGEGSNDLGTPSVYDPPETASEGLSPAGDVWSLGMTLVEVLTQKAPVLEAGRKETALPPSVPSVLADVARHCLCLDPKQRWSVEQIATRVSPVAAAAPTRNEVGSGPQATQGGKRIYVAAAVAVAVLLAVFAASRRSTPSRPDAQTLASVEAKAPVANDAATSAPAPAAKPAPAPAAKPAPAARVESQNPQQQAIVREVLPKVPKSARDTIQGTIRVRIRVALDEAGSVTGARFDSAGPSKYFARLAMQAAQGWKFAAPQSGGPNPAKEWLLRFDFRRDSTHVVPTPVAP